MIFSSFGNVPAGFSRLAAALEAFARSSGEEVIVQYGNTEYDFVHVTAVKFMDHEQMSATMTRAELLVLQGGWGTISEALLMGKRIVAVPRRCPVEHNHDQGELVRKLESLGTLIGCYDEQELPEKIALARRFDFKTLQRGAAWPVIDGKLREWGV